MKPNKPNKKSQQPGSAGLPRLRPMVAGIEATTPELLELGRKTDAEDCQVCHRHAGPQPGGQRA